ncbi:MAG: TonB-dependent receptor, partial [Gammaproteobacteria bacterium]|nr:TonB-dependent receptor [Gammaproteobacteria bacterium]
QTFFRVSDPCDIRNKQNANRVTNCAALGVPEQFVSTATGSSIEGLSGGNRNLKAEESDSYTIGFVYQPEWVDNVTLTVDYWSIKIDDAISAISAQNVVNKCVDNAEGINNVFCQQIVRDPQSSELKLITSSVLNVAAQTAEGVDFELGYDFDAVGGRFKTKILGTYLDSRKTFSFQNNPSDFEQRAGTEGEATWQENYSVAYSRDAWTATWKTRHLSGVSLYTDQSLAINPDPSDIMGYGSYFVSDISVGYEFANGLKWTVGIDNLFDRDLPGVTTGTGTGSASYDNIGQLFYTTLSFKM